MRKILGPLALLVAVVGAAPTSFAQNKTPYDYPWCAQYDGRASSGALSCYYATFAQCMATMSGIGGNCIRSPYYGQGPSQRSRYQPYQRY
jgi:hypothetical protein